MYKKDFEGHLQHIVSFSGKFNCTVFSSFAWVAQSYHDLHWGWRSNLKHPYVTHCSKILWQCGDIYTPVALPPLRPLIAPLDWIEDTASRIDIAVTLVCICENYWELTSRSPWFAVLLVCIIENQQIPPPWWFSPRKHNSCCLLQKNTKNGIQ